MRFCARARREVDEIAQPDNSLAGDGFRCLHGGAAPCDRFHHGFVKFGGLGLGSSALNSSLLSTPFQQSVDNAC